MVSMQSSVESATMVEKLLEQQRQMMREQRDYEEKKMAEMEAKLHAKDAKMEAKDARMEAKIAEERAKLEAKVAELTPPSPVDAIADEQLPVLQDRLERLHTAKLLVDEVRTTSTLL
eukprot:COSAG06_NODE_1387_length_9616_cov_4.512136_4_plen_117_part_00